MFELARDTITVGGVESRKRIRADSRFGTQQNAVATMRMSWDAMLRGRARCQRTGDQRARQQKSKTPLRTKGRTKVVPQPLDDHLQRHLAETASEI
jgi:hypothetical protein